MSVQPLNFYYNKSSPNYKRTDVVLNNNPGSLIVETYVFSPIYNFNNVKIGDRSAKLTTQQIEENRYEHIILDTFNIKDQGDVTILYSLINDSSKNIYPIDQEGATNIISTTGNYFGLKGTASVFTKSDGSRYVNISFFV